MLFVRNLKGKLREAKKEIDNNNLRKQKFERDLSLELGLKKT
jgi:hypothetical protein